MIPGTASPSVVLLLQDTHLLQFIQRLLRTHVQDAGAALLAPFQDCFFPVVTQDSFRA